MIKRVKATFFIVLICIPLFLSLILNSLNAVKPQEQNDNGLIITKSADKTVLESDSGNNVITYTINVENNKICTAPIDVVLVMDKSNTMGKDGNNPLQPMTDAMESANYFIDQLKRHIDHVGLVSFADKIKRDSPLTSDGTAVKQLVIKLDVGGEANMGDGIYEGIQEIESPRHDEEAIPYIIVISNGRPTLPGTLEEAKSYAIQAAASAKAKGITVISIGIGTDVDADTLIQIASPNLYYFAPSSSQLTAIYQKISRSLQGFSPNTIISDDLTNILKVAKFLSADNGGHLVGNRVIWDLGDFECGASKTLKFQVQLKNNPPSINDKVIENQAKLSNGSGESTNSNVVEVVYKSPELTISHTDNVEITRMGNTLTYTTVVTNNGDGIATDMQVQIPLLDKLILNNGSINNNGSLINGKFVWNGITLLPGQSIELKYTVNVGEGFADGYSNLISTATLNNNELLLNATDSTQVFVPPPEPANFDIAVNCVEITDDTFTAYFDYNNKRNVNQPLDESSLSPESVTGTPPTSLNIGLNRKSFRAIADKNVTIVWTVRAGNITKTASATSSNNLCSQDGEDTPGDTITDVTINPIPQEIDNEIIGTPIVEVKPSVLGSQQNQTPVVTISELRSECKAKQIIVGNCQSKDNDGAIELMQYSLDNGASWHPMKNISSLGTKNVSCQISTQPLRDGTYSIIARSRDNNDGWGYSRMQEYNHNCESNIVIGTNYSSVKGLTAPLASVNAELYSAESLPTEFSIEITGGPQKANLIIKETETTGKEFELKYNRELNLWTTTFVIEKAGTYDMEIDAVEAGNKHFKRTINPLKVLEVPELNQENVELTLFYRTNGEESWRLWDGSSYNQQNPFLSQSGKNILLVPKGEYYTQVTKEGFVATNSNILRVAEPTYIGVSGSLIQNNNIFAPLLNLNNQLALERLNFIEGIDHPKSLVNKEAPEFILTTSDKQIDKSVLRGERTLIVSWNQWHPLANEQLQFLKDIAHLDPELQIILVNSQIGFDLSQNYISRGDYEFTLFYPNQEFYEKWWLNSLPTNYFINQAGVVKNVTTDVITPLQYRELAKEYFNYVL